MKNLFKIFVPIFLVLTLIIAYVQPFIKTSESISDSVFRLHILANSDNSDDQALKLKVRDAVLAEGCSIFENCETLEEVLLTCNEHIDYFKSIAEKCIEDNGYDYDVNAYVDKEYFNTRQYDNITLPSGIYNALKIEIGEGKGHNWWCVMFPAICLPTVSEDEINEILSDEEIALINGNSKYDVRFKIVEIYEKMKKSKP